MKEFINKKKEIPFDKYLSRNLNLNYHQNYNYTNFISCGSSALGLLLNKNPLLIDKQCPTDPKKGWYTTHIVNYLKSKKYTVLTLSKNTVLPIYNHLRFPITSNHVLLINSRVNRNENSMFIVHKNKIWHNYEDEDMNPLFFINKPTQDVLLIHHKKWL